MPSRNEPNDAMSPNANHRSFLVTLSARAIGSLGFGLSILAIGLQWLVPLATAVAPRVADKPKQRANHRSRRRSAPAVPARPVLQQATPPITVNGQSTTSNSYRDKHVYFADTPDSQRSPIPTNDPAMTLHDSSEEQSSAEENPSPSTPTPPTTPPYLTNVIVNKQDDESIVESDSSSRRSSLSFHLPKRILHFGNKSRQHPDPSPSPTVARPLSFHGEGKHSRRSNIGFVPPWTSRRKSLDTQPDPNVDASSRPSSTLLKSANFPSVSSGQPSVVSYFSLKAHHRRTSAPTTRMRTQPYDAPYFALPPTSADLHKSPPMLQEALINSTMQHALEDNRGRPLQTPRQSLTRRRSASEDWNNGRRTRKIF